MNDFAVHVERADGEVLTFFTGTRYEGSKYGLGIKGGGFTGWSRRRMRGTSTPRPYQHGDILGERYRDGQKITIEGPASTLTQIEMDALDERVTSFLTEGEECRIIVDKAGERRWVDAVLDEVDFAQLHYKPRADVLMSFVAPDSVRYGTQHRVVVPLGATVDVPNWGGLDSWPEMTVSPVTSTPNGYAVRLFDDANPELGYWRISAALASTHTLDFKRAQVRWGGAVRFNSTYGLTSPFQIPRGRVSKLRLEFPGVGSASATISYADSY